MPTNAESAGKRFSSRTRKGDRYPRSMLVQRAWAAARVGDRLLSALFSGSPANAIRRKLP
jgi:hypothetical protein